jgi:tRNA-Thr(GGU) m(6)t(6)A37 methyltransferase TsaA
MAGAKKAQRGEDTPQMLLRPVGVVRNALKKPSLVADSGDLEWRPKVAQGREEQDAISELVIDSDLEGILDGIEDFSHIMVLYWAHHVPPEGRSLLKGHPMGRRDLPLTGIFATCSPARPNPICLIAVQLLERKDNVLKVRGLDAIDGSPLIDIKPYVPSYYAVVDAKRADWMMQIEREFAEGSFPITASGEPRNTGRGCEKNV